MKRLLVIFTGFCALAAALECAKAASAAAAGKSPLVPDRVKAEGIPAPLTAERGDAVRGRAVVLSRDSGNCFLCHSIPDAKDTPQGNVGPPLAGVGARLTAGQLRLRLVDSALINRKSIMPAYYRVSGLNRVDAKYRGKPILTAQQIEDVIAYLLTLRD